MIKCLKCCGMGGLVYLLNNVETAYICLNCKNASSGQNNNKKFNARTIDDAERQNLPMPEWQRNQINSLRSKLKGLDIKSIQAGDK